VEADEEEEEEEEENDKGKSQYIQLKSLHLNPGSHNWGLGFRF
jgi:hypothetical protein